MTRRRAGDLREASAMAMGMVVAVAVTVVASSACVSGGREAPASEPAAASARAAWDTRRAEAFRPRRFKALYSGEISAGVGGVVHGYLSVFWDGERLAWRASAPLAGGLKSGELRRRGEGGPAGAASPFPGALTEADVVGVLLGVLDLPAEGRPVVASGASRTILLDEAGRRAELGGDGMILGFRFPGGEEARVETGAGGMPRIIVAKGRSGRAKLTLESLGEWPESEPLPPG